VIASNVAYQPFGGVKSYTLGNGQGYTRSYDGDGRIASYSLGAQSFTIGYDNASRITSIDVNTYGYDALDRLTSATLPANSFAYGYDAVGNRTSMSGDTYIYSSTSNQIASITPLSGPVRSFSFDANGSTIDDGINQYGYDARGRMTQSIGALGTTTYQVNALGQRVRKTNTSDDRVFVYDTKGRLIEEANAAGQVLTEYLYLGDIPVALSNSQGTYYIHPDHLNTPRLIADSTGTTVWRWDQGEPFGNDVPNNNPSGLGVFDFPLRFPGQYFDRETSLAYNYLRDYDPGIGRYEESDPIGLSGGLNAYLYVDGNPVIKVDPQGDSAAIALGGLGGGAGAAGAVGGGLALGGAFLGGYALGTALYDQFGDSFVDLLILASRGRWTCTAKCAHTAIPPNNCCEPPFLTGKGSGHSQEAACRAAKRDATTSASPGCYGRHCRCTACWKN
jgi:RHS repeat-associated protein